MRSPKVDRIRDILLDNFHLHICCNIRQFKALIEKIHIGPFMDLYMYFRNLWFMFMNDKHIPNKYYFNLPTVAIVAEDVKSQYIRSARQNAAMFTK